ncbi:MAG: hypothetical protein ACR2RB_01930 [Gammaproteobacteria bacterium]
MDEVKNFIKHNGGELMTALIDVGFNAEQAERFLPEACDDIMQSLARPARRKEQIYRVMAHADVRGLASLAGVDSPLASTGVVTLMLGLLDVMHAQSSSSL